jgi:pyruvate/2-oxoacid:ferredoxin oxidoreductase beta subunit/Pyruvate/2-oxoacid:ferredoxin oxidoreductase gamma subunit
MASLLNQSRPPAYCPGCAYEKITRALDNTFKHMGLEGNQIAMISDIGCSGLFDTFFHTHALHGLHGRALTYATGLKMAQPELNIVVTMGDGGLGIGGAHFLSACRRNLNVTLLILNNFNFGMTGGQFSSTTPAEALVSSGFLNQLEKPIDACRVARSAGAPYVRRCSSYSKDLVDEIEQAIRFNGFSVVDIWGACTGRYTKRNKLTPQMIAENLEKLPPMPGEVEENIRKEFGQNYHEQIAGQKPVPPPEHIESIYAPPARERKEVVILGSAGQRIVTAGEILCMAALTAGLNTTQKNEYNITVLRGPSISELILSPETIGFTGIDKPDVILVLGQEGVERRKDLFSLLNQDCLVVQAQGIEIPKCSAKIHKVDFKMQKVKTQDWALATLSVLAHLNQLISMEMLHSALDRKFNEPLLSQVRELVERVAIDTEP